MRDVPPPPEIRAEKCTGCELCVIVCPASVLVMEQGLPRVDRDDFCLACGHCSAVCPTGAVSHAVAGVESRLTMGSGPAVSPEALQQLLRERRSVRRYKPDPVPRDALEKIINAGRYAPTGGNSQNVEYVVLTDPREIDRLRELTLKFLVRSYRIVGNPIGALYVRLVASRKTLEQVREYEPGVREVIEKTKQGDDRVLWQAPAVVLVHAPAWDPTSGFNCVAALYSASLMAHTLGIGACFNGFVEHCARQYPPLKKFVNIPRENKCFGVMTLGFQGVKYQRLVERRVPKIAWR